MVLNIPGRFGVEHQILVLVPTQILWLDTEVDVILKALRSPLFIGGRRLLWANKVLHLHLLKLALTEDKLPGGDLITKRLTNLSNTEWHLDPRRIKYVFEIDIDTLARLTTEIRRLFRPVTGKIS